jgi:hypothetical protein
MLSGVGQYNAQGNYKTCKLERMDGQQISHSSQGGVYNGSNWIHCDPPRPDAHAPLLNDHDVLLDAVRGEDHARAIRVARDALGLGLLPHNGNVPPVELSIQPSRLLPGLEGQQGSKDDSQRDQEDAGPHVAGSASGRPHRGEERRGRALEEGHGCRRGHAWH